MTVLRGALGALFLMGLSGFALADLAAAPKGDVLLTISGQVSVTNGPGRLDLDQAQLDALPQTEFTTSTTWTSGTPVFKGVLLKDLIEAVGAQGTTITLTAANDYSITMPMADVAEDAPLLAYLVDGQTMSLRDKGPVWLVYPYDLSEDYRTEEIYSRSIWQLTEMSFSQ